MGFELPLTALSIKSHSTTEWCVTFSRPIETYRGTGFYCSHFIKKEYFPDRMAAFKWAQQIIKEQTND
jgi:hypothetical protein